MTEPQARSWANAAAAQGVLTVTGLLPGISAVAVGAVLAATVWLLAIGVAACVWTGLIAGCLAWLSIPSGSWPWAGPWRHRAPFSRSHKSPSRLIEGKHDP